MKQTTSQEQNRISLPSFSKYVIVDTCILIDADSKQKSKSEAVIQCLEELIAEEYRLAISEITMYEFLRRLWGKAAGEAAHHLTRYEGKVVSKNVLLTSAVLEGLYIFSLN